MTKGKLVEKLAGSPTGLGQGEEWNKVYSHLKDLSSRFRSKGNDDHLPPIEGVCPYQDAKEMESLMELYGVNSDQVTGYIIATSSKYERSIDLIKFQTKVRSALWRHSRNRENVNPDDFVTKLEGEDSCC